jgi:hypothetical protein
MRHLTVVGNRQLVSQGDFQSAADPADICFMTGSRCPACGASTPDAASWCSLCYADLRPAPIADAPAPSSRPSEVAPPTGVDTRPDPLTAPISTLLAPAESVAPQPAPEAAPAAVPVPAEPLPAVVAVDPELDPAEAVTWPCQRCGAAVALALDACPECGAGFLDGAVATPDLSVPLVGNLTRFSSGQRLLLAAGLAFALIVVFLAVAAIGGAIL